MNGCCERNRTKGYCAWSFLYASATFLNYVCDDLAVVILKVDWKQVCL